MNVEQALGVFERALVACEQDGRSRVVRDGLDHEVWVASDMDGIRLLVAEEEAFQWRELNAALEGRIVNIGEGAWFEIRAPSLARPRTAGFFAELISTCPDQPQEVRTFVEHLLDEWEDFFSGIRAPLSAHAQCGLFGELLVLEHLLGLKPMPMDHWTGPTGHLHDFVFEPSKHRIEVKTSLRQDPVAHISEFDQLQCSPEFELHLVFVALKHGDRSLVDLISDLRDLLAPAEQKNFNGRLGLLGYSDEDAPLYARGYDVASCDLKTIEPSLGLLSPARLVAGTVYDSVSWRLRKSSIDGFLPMNQVGSMLEGMW